MAVIEGLLAVGILVGLLIPGLIYLILQILHAAIPLLVFIGLYFLFIIIQSNRRKPNFKTIKSSKTFFKFCHSNYSMGS